MGKIETAKKDYGYAGLTLPQMLVAGLFVAPKTETAYQQQVKLTVLGGLQLLIEQMQSGEFGVGDSNVEVVMTDGGEIPLLDFEHIEELFLAMSVGMIIEICSPKLPAKEG